MKFSRNARITAILLIICLAIKVYSLQAIRVESGYSTELFPPFAKFLRGFFGSLSVSIGDLLYASVVAWIVFYLIKLMPTLARYCQTLFSRIRATKIIYTVLIALACVYIVFNLFWGINYNRKGIAWQLSLPALQYSQAELREMNCLLLSKVNEAKADWASHKKAYPGTSNLFIGVEQAFKKVTEEHPFLEYENPSLKPSLWGWFGNYAGFNGYYNPITGEAQVNTNIPKFLQPFTACHEVAHQIGYAKEMEANFVGYLAAASSQDPLFNYSVYLELFTYANRNLFTTDSVSARLIRNELSAPVKSDLKEWRLFNNKHRSFLEPAVRWGYGIFLRNNEQPQGVLSYDEVTGFLIAYHKKYGKL